MKNHKFKMLNSVRTLLLGIGLTSCGEESSDVESEGETLAEYVARCESFTGDSLEDCPEDCRVVRTIRILYDGSACEMEMDGDGLPVEHDLCLAADPDYIGHGSQEVYRRVEVGETPEDPATPTEPEEVLRLDSDEYAGWERCTEDKSDYCGCALQFADSD